MSSPNSKGRPRSRSMLSFGSNKSSDSKPKYTKAELAEAAREKTQRRMTTKANPNVAVDELEPVAQALEKPTVTSNLRSMSFNDQYGNPITDPDRSNPTRPRLERPLDTIRSFEAAIDGSYNRRMSRISEPMSPAQSRPSSYYPGMNGNFNQRFAGDGGAYGNRMAPSRPESYIDAYAYGNGNRQSPMPFGNQRRSYAPPPRNNSDPIMYGHNSHGMYGQPQRREPPPQNYDTATQGSGSGGSHGTEPWSNSTDPSSEASSVDRLQQQQPPPPPKADLGEQYGFSGFGGAPQGLENGQDAAIYGLSGNGLSRRAPTQSNEIPPPPPPHFSNNPVSSTTTRRPVRANTLQKQPTPTVQEVQPRAKRVDTGGEKRMSWLKRRFSRNS